MKGIVLAGGSGTRLYPITHSVSKQLLPVYDKPMIYYPISVLMLAGIRDILIISTPADLPNFKRLLGTGEQFGVRFEYCEQPRPEGLTQAFLLGADFIDGDACTLVLGDNIFFGSGFRASLRRAMKTADDGAHIFGCRVNDPERYGVVEFDEKRNVIGMEEKPEHPKTDYAIPGLYFFDSNVVEYARRVRPGKRGELEITDLLRIYMDAGKLKVDLLGRGVAWLDTGTYRSLLEASNFVETIQNRQGLKIACLEEIAFLNGWVTRENLLEAGRAMSKNEYGRYLVSLAQGKKDAE